MGHHGNFQGNRRSVHYGRDDNSCVGWLGGEVELLEGVEDGIAAIWGRARMRREGWRSWFVR
jgi:hypothetical protein